MSDELATAVRSVRRWIIGVGAALALGVLALAWDAREARQANCELVRDAFAAEHEGLVAASEPPGGRTDEQQAELEQRIQVLNAIVDPILARCE